MAYLGSGPAPKATELDANSVETADIQNNAVTTDKIANGAVTQAKLDSNINLGLKVTGVDYPGDDTAADPAGGQTITITGSGFAPTPTVYIDTTLAPAVTFVSNTEITITTPAKAAGTYSVYVINPDGTVGIRVMGISYSGTPTWVTPAGSLGSVDAEAISIQLVATGDTPLVYSLTTGSTLPAGVTLSSSGLISGTLATEQTFSFSVDVTDPENQTTPRSFSVTVVLGEPDFKFVTLLLHGDGTSGAQNNTFLDSSTNNFTITRNGNTTQGTFTPFSKPDGRWGLRTNDRSHITMPASSQIDLINTDFTIEFWFKLNAFNTMQYSGDNLFGTAYQATNGWGVSFGGSGTTVTSLTFFRYEANASAANTFSVSLTNIMSTWHHIAFVRSGSGAGNLKLYVNGTQIGSAQNAVTYSTTGGVFVLGSGAYIQNGTYSGNADYYVSNVRVTKSAVYTGNFTVPSSPLTQLSGTILLLCQSNRLVNNGTYNAAITSSGYTGTRAQVTVFSPFPRLLTYSASVDGGSGYFDGTGDNLRLVGSSATAFGTNPFCVEAWIYPTSLYNYKTVVSTRESNSVFATAWGLGIHGNGIFEAFGAATILVTASGIIQANMWHHVVFCRNSSNNAALFVNGVRVAYSASITTNYNYERVGIGDHSITNAEPFTGYISQVRLVKGSNVYDPTQTTLAIPTTSLTAVSGTSLLANFTNAGVIDHSMSNNLETIGNAQIDTGTVKYGTGALEFDGSGDYLDARLGSDNILIGDFTVEMWVYPTAITGSNRCFLFLENGSNSPSFFMYGATGYIALDIANVATYNLGSTAITTNSWQHLAFVRSGSTLTGYINGTATGTATVTASLGGAGAMRIGAGGGGAANYAGFIDDLRITKGKARYTSNFTPPTAAFADKGQA